MVRMDGIQWRIGLGANGLAKANAIIVSNVANSGKLNCLDYIR